MREKEFDRGIALYKGGKFSDSLLALNAAIETTQDGLAIAYYAGLCYVRLGKLDKAEIALRRVVEEHSNFLYIYQSRMILAYIFCLDGRYDNAEDEIMELLKGGYESAQVYSTYGYLLHKKKQPAESIKMLEKALSLDGDNSNALNSLGYILAECEENLETAIDYCRRAVNKNSSSYAYLDSLGWACFKAGRIGEARRYLSQAMSLSKGSGVVADHLKEVLALSV